MYSLAMFDEDGPGPREANLFIGGIIVRSAVDPNPGLLRWDGRAYSIVGGGLAPDPRRGYVYVLAMTVWDDDGPGPRTPALYVAGTFHTAGGIPAGGVARWDGQSWEALGGGLDAVRALAGFDADGSGPEPPMLYAGGGFVIRDPDGNWIRTLARFNGTDWVAVPGWNTGGIGSLEVFDDDGDPATPPGLYVCGNFFYAGGIYTPGLARWGCPYAACYADCEASTGLSTLDIFDYLCFQHRFVTADPYACDCDTSTGNGVCDLLDFLCFQSAFLTGCP